jgi:phytoene dehydrogenase-like protein
MDADSELVPRTILLDEFGISDSCERRRRKEGADWPPHLLIGRKVYYRRESLSDWLRQRESATQSVQRGLDRTGDAEAMTAVLRQAKVLADAAPPLTAEQALLLRHLMRDTAGVATK